MTIVRQSRALFLAGLGLLLPGVCGCLLPLCLPTTAETSRVDLGRDSKVLNEVHVFRVDITRTTDGWTSLWSGLRDDGPVEQHRLSGLIPVEPGMSSIPDEIPEQKTWGWHYGYGFFLPLSNYHHYVKPALALRLYRPGYELVVLNADYPIEDVQWTHANDLLAQMQALDLLFHPEPHMFMPATQQGSWLRGSMTLEPGSVSPAHRQALLFGAEEYERLASLAQLQMPRDRRLLRQLHDRAHNLRDLAAH
jgi:hypothetical protein